MQDADRDVVFPHVHDAKLLIGDASGGASLITAFSSASVTSVTD